MTKLALCMECLDMVSPFRNWKSNRDWRWCQCGSTATRWRDGGQGLIEVTARDGRSAVRVVGLNNAFLTNALLDPPPDPAGWRQLHDTQCRVVPATYLFHEARRACWALVVRPGESGDVFYVEFPPAELKGDVDA